MRNKEFREILYEIEPETRGNYTYIYAHRIDIIYDRTNDVFVFFSFKDNEFLPTNKQLEITKKYILDCE